MTLSSSGLESWFPRNNCFYQDVHHYCIDLADEIATWPFWVPYATEPTGKGKNYSSGWSDWHWLTKENWVAAAQRGRRRLYLKFRVPFCIFTSSGKSWSKMNIFPLHCESHNQLWFRPFRQDRLLHHIEKNLNHLSYWMKTKEIWNAIWKKEVININLAWWPVMDLRIMWMRVYMIVYTSHFILLSPSSSSYFYMFCWKLTIWFLRSIYSDEIVTEFEK